MSACKAGVSMRKILIEARLAARRTKSFLTFWRTAKAGVRGHTATLLVMCIMWLASKALVDAVWAGDNYSFNEWGMVTAFAGWATIAVAMLLLHPQRKNVPVRLAIIDAAALGHFFNILTATLGFSISTIRSYNNNLTETIYKAWFVISWGIFLWMIFSLIRAGRHLWKSAPRFAGLRYTTAVLLPLALIPQQPLISGSYTNWDRIDFWNWARDYLTPMDMDSASSESDSERPVDYEGAIFRQQTLVTEALKSIGPSPKNRPQFFFVGLAPSSAQSVFQTEVLGAKEVFDDRFNTKGHSIALINSVDTMNSLPLASATNLAAVLSGVSKQMDIEKDVLLLFVTSHGSKGNISVQMPGIQLNQITDEVLANILAASEIKNKVIIISACHSGSFIPRLKDRNTLIMTAASAEKTSFGCSNEREWTYFGDALFNHAFKNTHSMSQAFSSATQLIAKWEADQKLASSEPQISMGTDLEKVLDKFELGVDTDSCSTGPDRAQACVRIPDSIVETQLTD
jgi:hypothetical protein